jgi:uroporphyrinogen-III synthase
VKACAPIVQPLCSSPDADANGQKFFGSFFQKRTSFLPRFVLITRPAGEAAGTASAVSALGYEPIVAPLFVVTPRAMAMPEAVQAVVVTSGHALPALPVVDVPILAVGDSTAARARARGFARVESAGGDAAALAGLVARRLAPGAGPLLLASGARQGHGIAADLRGRGFRVIRRVCYSADPVRNFPDAAAGAIRCGDVHAVLFLSAETAAAFVRLLPSELNDALASVTALAIGKTTADVLEGLPWLRIRRARTPTLDDVLALI